MHRVRITVPPVIGSTRTWLAKPNRWDLPWLSLLGFLRLVTNPRVFTRPATATDAWERIEDWIGRAGACVPLPTLRHPVYLARIIRHGNVSGDLVPDAHLAALALEHGLTVASADYDFARFEGVRWFNPGGQRRCSSVTTT